MQQIEIGQMVFLRDGEVGVGAVREVRKDGAELVINIETSWSSISRMGATSCCLRRWCVMCIPAR